MAVDDEYRTRDSDYMRRMDRHEDRVRDAHTNSHVARLLAIMALILSAIALWAAMTALNKATDALNLANRNLDTLQSQNRSQ
jgi:hypothetical protein